MATKEKKSNAGRKRIELTDEDWARIIGMIRIQCTAVEICNVMGFSEDTLSRRIAENEALGADNFAELYKKNSDAGKASLRRLQWKSAESGSQTMQIWLGKQMLGQKDRHDLEVGGSEDRPVVFKWKD